MGVATLFAAAATGAAAAMITTWIRQSEKAIAALLYHAETEAADATRNLAD